MKNSFKARIYKAGINHCVKVPARITKRMMDASEPSPSQALCFSGPGEMNEEQTARRVRPCTASQEDPFSKQ